MILFYVNQVNPRWIYTLDFIFKVRGIKYQITDDLERFNNSSKHKVNLTQKETTAPVNFTVSKLLEEVEIRPFLIKKGKFFQKIINNPILK